MMRILIHVLLLTSAFIKPTTADEVPNIEGRVVDEVGKPAANASIDFFWRANGPWPYRDEHGKPIDPKDEESSKSLWGHVGQMESFRVAKSGEDGRFSIERPDNFHTLMAMDAERVRGGLAEIPKDKSAPVEIRLQPMVRLAGRFEGPDPGQRPSWTHVWILVPDDPTRPLHMNRLVSCGSDEARFAVSLPPGRYALDANDDGPSSQLQMEIVLKSDTPKIDLGTLKLARITRQNINQKIKQSQASGAMRDYKNHYGEKLPDWHIVDARGVNKNIQLADYKGKWVLVNFWALNCNACLKNHLPRLTRIYRDHLDQRDRFEILAICVDCDEKMKSIAEVDQALEPIVKYVWDGQPLPFPVLLDPSMTTLERFGVPGYETILVDPDGNLVEGDELTLAEKLKQRP